MPSRLRKIEKSYSELPELSQQAEEKQTIIRKVKKITVITLIVLLPVLIYFIFLSPVSGYVIVNANSVKLKTPQNASIVWITDKIYEEVKKGETLAELKINVGNAVAIRKEITQLEIELSKAKIDIDSFKTELNREKANYGQDKIKYGLNVEIAADKYERAVNSLKKAKDIYEARKKDKEKAGRLWNLDAISKTDYHTVVRMFAVAESDYKNAVVFLKSRESEKKAAKAALKEFLSSSGQKIHSLEEVLANSRDYASLLEKNIARMEGICSGNEEYNIKIASPMDGVLFNKYKKTGEYISRGEEVLSVYNPETVALYAYLRGKHNTKIKSGRKARVKIMGEYFDTFVKNVKPELVIAPKEFQITKIAPKDEYYTVVELDITRMPQGVIPGEIGKIIFK